MIKVAFLILLALVALPHPVSGQTAASYAIQVDTFKDLKKAAKQTDLLKKKGLDAFWKEEQPVGKPKRYIVCIGNYESRDETRDEAKRLKREPSRVEANGQFIERIRTFYHHENRTLRVVLDLQPSKSYRISQFFYQAQNVYTVEVEAE